MFCTTCAYRISLHVCCMCSMQLYYIFSEERPDLRVIGIIWYTRNSKVQEYRAIDEIATEWQAIGRELGLKGSKIKNINGSHHGDDCAAASDMLSFWLGSDLEATWARLIKAMKVKEDLKVEAARFEYALLHRVED